MEFKLSDIQLDALKEIGTIGAGNAATSLSQLLDRKIKIEVPNATMIKVEEVPAYYGGLELLRVGLYFNFISKLGGRMLFFTTYDEGLHLAQKMLENCNIKVDKFDEMSTSALKELSNIMVGSYLSALYEMLNLSFLQSPPIFIYDMLGAILDSLCNYEGMKSDYLFCINTKFIDQADQLNMDLLFIPPEETLKEVFKQLNISYGETNNNH